MTLRLRFRLHFRLMTPAVIALRARASCPTARASSSLPSRRSTPRASSSVTRARVLTRSAPYVDDASPTSTRAADDAGGSAARGARVHVRVATTAAHAAAAAKVCGDAFAYETRVEEKSERRGDALDDAAEAVKKMLDDAYARSIAKELKHMTTHQIEERKKASREIREMKKLGDEYAKNDARALRARQKAQCLTLISRLDEAVADDESRWVGSASLRVCSPEALFPEPFPTTKPRVPYVSNVAVKADARGRGVASSMLVKCERASRLWGYTHLWLHVDVDNQRAREMYERRGYVACGEDPWWYGLGGVLGARRVLLKKLIGEKQ